MLSDRERAMERHPDDFETEDGDIDFEEDDYFDCAMDRRGSCGKAGSEECEFECPYRAEQRAVEQRRGSR